MVLFLIEEALAVKFLAIAEIAAAVLSSQQASTTLLFIYRKHFH